jgi:uncharacterized protein (DUF433 family)
MTLTYDDIRWHPGRRSGQATLGSSGLIADTLASLVWAGDDVGEIAADYEVPVFAVELSCWWVALHQPGRLYAWQRQARRAWRLWAAEWGVWAWHSERDPATHPGRPRGKDET